MEQLLKISSLIKSLEHLINSQRYKDAEKLAKSVLAAAPKHLEVSYLLAIALQGQGNYAFINFHFDAKEAFTMRAYLESSRHSLHGAQEYILVQ